MSVQSLVRLSQIKKNPRLIMPMSKKCQNMKKKLQSMSYNMMIGYDIYDRFTMEYFSLRQSMILTTNFFCSRQYLLRVLSNFDAKSELFLSMSL
jgi:hypothetical protein